jgi:hypothetical protein
MEGLCSSKVCTYIPCGGDYNMVQAAVAKVSPFKRTCCSAAWCCIDIVMLMIDALQIQSFSYACHA